MVAQIEINISYDILTKINFFYVCESSYIKNMNNSKILAPSL